MLIHKDLPYSEQKTDVRLLDWFAPEGDCRATMVWMHGGGIEGGDRRGFDGIASQLCAAGIGIAPPRRHLCMRSAPKGKSIRAYSSAARRQGRIWR